MVDLQKVFRALKGVHSNAQARAALGAAALEVHRGFALVEGIKGWGSGDKVAAGKRRLNAVNAKLQAEAKRLGRRDGDAVGAKVWATMTPVIVSAYQETYGLEGAVDTSAAIDVADILGESILKAPGVFAAAVGTVAGAAVQTAGEVAGKGVWAIVKQAWPVLLVAVVVLVVLWKLKR